MRKYRSAEEIRKSEQNWKANAIQAGVFCVVTNLIWATAIAAFMIWGIE